MGLVNAYRLAYGAGDVLIVEYASSSTSYVKSKGYYLLGSLVVVQWAYEVDNHSAHELIRRLLIILCKVHDE